MHSQNMAHALSALHLWPAMLGRLFIHHTTLRPLLCANTESILLNFFYELNLFIYVKMMKFLLVSFGNFLGSRDKKHIVFTYLHRWYRVIIDSKVASIIFSLSFSRTCAHTYIDMNTQGKKKNCSHG